MSFHWHARCDNCEKFFPGDGEQPDEDVMLESGWFSIALQANDNKVSKDFCCARCVAIWAESQDRAREDNLAA